MIISESFDVIINCKNIVNDYFSDVQIVCINYLLSFNKQHIRWKNLTISDLESKELIYLEDRT